MHLFFNIKKLKKLFKSQPSYISFTYIKFDTLYFYKVSTKLTKSYQLNKRALLLQHHLQSAQYL